MGFTKQPAGVAQFNVVGTTAGSAEVLDPDGRVRARHPKARMFVLADRTAVLVTPTVGGPARSVDRETFTVLESSWQRSAAQLTAVTADGAVLVAKSNGCGCGLGAVGNAGPTGSSYRLHRVRAPEWHTVDP